MKIYTKEDCTKCTDLKTRLDKAGVEYEEEMYTECIHEVADFLKANSHAILPIMRFDDNKFVSNDQGLFKELKERKIL